MTITQWRAIPTVPPIEPGTYNMLDALSENLRKAQVAINTIQSANYSGLFSVGAGPGLTATTTNGVAVISPGTELAGLAGLSTTGFVERTGTGQYITVPVPGGGAPGRAQVGVPTDVQPFGYLHENLSTGDLYASHPVPVLAIPTVVNFSTAGTAFVATPSNHYELTMPFTPTAGNLVIIGTFNNNYTTAPTGWTIVHQANGAFTNSTWYAKVWAASDPLTHIVWPDGSSVLLNVWEVRGAGNGTVASAFDGGSTTGATTGTPFSGFTGFYTAVANELSLGIATTQSGSDPPVTLDVSWTQDSIGTGQNTAAHKLIGVPGTQVTMTQNSQGFFTNRSLSAITLKPGITTSNYPGWSFIGPVKSYNNGTFVDSQLKTLSFSGLNVSASSDGAGNVVVGITNAPPLTVNTTNIVGGTTGNILYDNGGTVGEVTVVPVANGGTGTATPALVAGSNVTITGAWPNQTIASTGGGVAVQNGGAVLGTASTLNFTGSGVSTAFASGTATVTVSGGGGGGGTSVSFGTGAPSASALPAVDGSVFTNFQSGGTSGTITFSTTSANRVAYLLIGVEQNTTIRVNSVTSSGLTWNFRGFATIRGGRANNTVEIWWASVPTVVTSNVVTITFSAAIDIATYGITIFKNLADITTPFDPNVSLPAFSTTAYPGPTSAPVFSTTNGYSFVVGASYNDSAATETSGWSSLFSSLSAAGGNWSYLYAFDQTYTTAQTSVTTSLTSGDNRICIRVADALTGYRGAAPSEGSLYFDTSTTPYTEYAYHSGAWHQAGASATSVPTKANQPTSSTFTVTLGSPTSKTDIPGVGVLADFGSFTASDNITGYGVPVPGSTPWTATLGLSSPGLPNAYALPCIYVSDGTKLIVFGYKTYDGGSLKPGVTVIRYSNLTTTASFPYTNEPSGPYNFFRIKNDGTNFTYSLSTDGYAWADIYSDAVGAFLGALVSVGFAYQKLYSPGPAPPSGTAQATIFYWNLA